MRRKASLRVAEAARLVGVSPSTLRRWEELGLVGCTRSQGGYRLFSRSALQQLRRVQRLRSVDRINPAGIRHLTRYQQRSAETTELDPSLQQVAVKLAALRRRKQFAAHEVAAKVGLSVSALLALETGRSVPSLAIVKKLAQLYETNLLSFFVSQTHRPLLHPSERPVLRADPGVEMELLALGSTLMEPHLFRVAPRSGSGGSYQHEGEEFIYVLDGKFEVWLDEIERYVLGAGDSLYFQSTRPHRWRAIGDQEAVVLWINTPPTF